MKTKIHFILVMLFTMVVYTSCTSSSGELSVKDVWARPTAAQSQASPTVAAGVVTTGTSNMDGMGSGPVSAAYMVIENKTNTSEKLISVNASVADMAQVHQTQQTSDGMTSMQEIQGGLDIPAQSSVILQPGSYHIMLTGLHQDLSVGQSFSLTLTFQSGKQITVDVPVKLQ